MQAVINFAVLTRNAFVLFSQRTFPSHAAMETQKLSYGYSPGENARNATVLVSQSQWFIQMLLDWVT